MQDPRFAGAAERLRRMPNNLTRPLVLRTGFLACVLAALLRLTTPAGAQQFVTDDAALVDFRACQLEGWHSESASWILPACQRIRHLEITAGIGFIPEDSSRSVEYVLQGKFVPRQVAPDRVGIGLVAGLGFGPLSEVVGEGVAGAFAYVPVSVSLAEDRLILHGNLGWHYERDGHHGHDHEHDGAHHALTWAARADVLLPFAAEHFTLLGEIFGEDRIRPEYQVGVRSTLIPERLLVDLSWGGHTAAAFAGAGWALGFAWTPPPFF